MNIFPFIRPFQYIDIFLDIKYQLYIKKQSCKASAILEHAVMHLKSLQYVSTAHSFHCSKHVCIYNGVSIIVILLSLLESLKQSHKRT